MLFPDDVEHLSALAELIRRWVSYRWHRADIGKRYAPHGGRGQARAVRDGRRAAGPVISVPTITLKGDANGAPHPDPSAYAKKFSGKYENRIIKGGIGHNLPQEAPKEFAQAVIDVDRF